MTQTLHDALIAEINRVRDEIMPAYWAVGPTGWFALDMMRAHMEHARLALENEDAVEMLRSLEVLKSYRK